MREILFRGKRQDGVWFEGSLLRYKVETPSRTENHYKIQEFNYGYSDDELINQEYMSGFDEEVIPETVGRYTGLTDKNGKKIFEGDILLYKYKHDKRDVCCNGWVSYNQKMCAHVIRYINGEFCFADEDFFEDVEQIEVIGNIYDNPELLGE